MAEAEVAAAQKMLEAAEMEMAAARQGQRDAGMDEERKDSVKAGIAAAAAGLVFSLPLLLSNQSGGAGGSVSAALGLAASVVSCFLFGVTYRYIVRYDITNTQLRGGAVGAFGLVRAGSAADVLQATSSVGPFDLDTVIGPAALYAGESMLLFTFAAAVVEKAFDLGLVKRFGPAPDPGNSSS
ncbi:hypothetical protein DUNSADRAFT_6497 [Dunaliella salina]|uniref:Uncharacterized protein n=1 Tax=Dunaliella salina TaxID=3046 RepID=A0ABQ7GNB1_DUNSA|nr:hypothetical protein DUNSADRAFT_6497 [Dunaliella salina]|eukprot:KAF5836077.1 hypothetical protein DUNSADRAFT_6497 [Dunaliella salina]